MLLLDGMRTIGTEEMTAEECIPVRMKVFEVEKCKKNEAGTSSCATNFNRPDVVGKMLSSDVCGLVIQEDFRS